MNITLMAHDKKKELMVQFCTAYKSVLMRHNLYATATTGRLVADATGLPITLFLAHSQGGQLPHHQPEGQGKEGPQQTVRADSTGCHRGCCRR